MRLFLFLFLAPMAWATPATRDADLKAVQMEVTVNSSGFLSGYVGGLTLETSTVDTTNVGLINSCSVLHSNLSEVSGASVGPTVPFDSTHSGTITVTGGTGANNTDGAGPGAAAQLSEGVKLVSSGVINGGSTGSTDGTSAPGTGGDATVFLDGTKTSWSPITFNPGGSDWNSTPGGNANLILNSTQTSATLYIAADNGNNNGGASPNAVSNIMVTGAVLTSLTLANYSCNSGFFGTHDYSNAALGMASVDALLVIYSTSFGGSSPTSGSLNVAGLCATPSTTGSDAAVVLASSGVIVTTN